MTTVLDVLDKGTAFLEKKGIEDARRNMQLLLAHVLGCSKIELYMRFDHQLLESQLEQLRSILKRRGAYEPLQHIIGTVEFYNREFKTDSRALIPRPETEELSDIILKLPLPHEIDILDMATGSGVLGITLSAELGEKCNSCLLADISEEALSLAEENLNALGVSSVELVQSDLFSNLQERKFHLIVANLPYVATSERDSLSPELLYDPDLALFGGEDGLDILQKFIQQAPAHLHPNGKVALEIGYDQAKAVESLLQDNHFTDITSHKDLNGIPRFPIATHP